VIVIDGRQRLMKVGETSPEGVRLVFANSEKAVFSIDGKEVTARLDGRVMARKRPARTTEVQVWRDPDGMYTTVGSINGLTVSFLVDTGATQIAMNADEAKRLGIDYRVEGRPARVTTASSIERAWSVTLDTVKVGDIKLRNVGAVVLEGTLPEQTLLGMSYLGRLNIENNGRLMTLRKKY
jgi:aspartyl protease family protein